MNETSDKISFLGQIDVSKAEIVSSAGKIVDITTLIGDITLYEDIFSNTMSGYLVVEDALDLISEVPLLGQELFRLSVKTPTLDNKFEKEFYIYKLQNRMVRRRSQSYVLHFCSKELITSTNSKVAKSFSGSISDTVKSIFKDPKYIGSDSTLYVDTTKNSYTFIAPYWTPFETINWLTGKSINKNGVSNYLFYEDNQAFQFTSIDSLMKADAKRDYIYSDIDANTMFGATSDLEPKYSVVESIEDAITFDYLRNLSAGMYSSKLYTLDLTTKNININTFDYLDDFNKATHLDKEPVQTTELIHKKIASLYFIHKNNYQTGKYKPQGYSDFFLQRNSLLEQLTAFKFVIKVPGRTDIKAGNIINFTVPDLRKILKDEIETTIKSDYFSGRYLITAIRHQILSGKHHMYLEIVSDSFIKKLT